MINCLSIHSLFGVCQWLKEAPSYEPSLLCVLCFSTLLVTPGNTVEPEFSASLSLYEPHFTARTHVVLSITLRPLYVYQMFPNVLPSLRLHVGVRSLDNVHCRQITINCTLYTFKLYKSSIFKSSLLFIWNWRFQNFETTLRHLTTMSSSLLWAKMHLDFTGQS